MTKEVKPGRLVVTVHGISTFGQWQERLEKLVASRLPDEEVYFVNYKYGYFSALGFLFPPARWLVVRKFQTEFARLYADHRGPVDLVGHSFGTHIIAWAIHGLAKKKRGLRVNTIILSGSILKSGFAWRDLIGSNVKRVVNDCGTKDNVLLLSQFFVLFTGMAGRIGFSGATSRTFRNRYSHFGHSGYFLDSLGNPDDSYMERNWIPLLTESSEPIYFDSRINSSWERLITLAANNAEPFKLLMYSTPLVLATLWIYGLYRAADIQRQIAIANEKIALHRLNESQIAQSRFLADRAENYYAAGAVTNSALTALAALPNGDRPEARPFVEDAEHALYKSLMSIRERYVKRARSIVKFPGQDVVALWNGGPTVMTYSLTRQVFDHSINIANISGISLLNHCLAIQTSSGARLTLTAELIADQGCDHIGAPSNVPVTPSGGNSHTPNAIGPPGMDLTTVPTLKSLGFDNDSTAVYKGPFFETYESLLKGVYLKVYYVEVSNIYDENYVRAAIYFYDILNEGSGKSIATVRDEIETGSGSHEYLRSKDKRRVLILGHSGPTTLVDVTLPVTIELDGSQYLSQSITFSDDDNFIIATKAGDNSKDTDIYIWDGHNGKKLGVVTAPGGLLGKLYFVPNSTLALAFTSTRSALAIDLSKGDVVNEGISEENPSAPSDVIIDGNRIMFISGADKLRVITLDNYKVMFEQSGIFTSRGDTSLSFSTSGEYAFVVTTNKEVSTLHAFELMSLVSYAKWTNSRLYPAAWIKEFASEALKGALQGDGRPSNVVISPDATFAAGLVTEMKYLKPNSEWFCVHAGMDRCYSEDYAKDQTDFVVWRLSNLEEVGRVEDVTIDDISEIDFDPAEKYGILMSKAVFYLFDAETSQINKDSREAMLPAAFRQRYAKLNSECAEAQQVKVREGIVITVSGSDPCTLSYSAGGERVLVRGNQRVEVWQIENGEHVEMLGVEEETANRIAKLSPDGFHALLIGKDDTVVLWSVSRNTLSELERVGHSGAEYNFSDDGNLVLKTEKGAVTAIWPTEGGWMLVPPQIEISGAAFDPDLRLLTIVGADASVRRWHIGTGVPVLSESFQPPFKGQWVITRDTKTAYLLTTQRTLSSYPLFMGVSEFVEYAKRAVPRCLTTEQRAELFLSSDAPKWCATKEE